MDDQGVMEAAPSLRARLRSEFYAFLFWALSFASTVIGTLTMITLSGVIPEFRVFGSLILICCTITNTIFLYGRVTDRPHLVRFTIPFIVVEALLVALTILLLVDQAPDQESWSFIMSCAALASGCVVQVLFVLVGLVVGRKEKNNDAEAHLFGNT